MHTFLLKILAQAQQNYFYTGTVSRFYFTQFYFSFFFVFVIIKKMISTLFNGFTKSKEINSTKFSIRHTTANNYFIVIKKKTNKN